MFFGRDRSKHVQIGYQLIIDHIHKQLTKLYNTTNYAWVGVGIAIMK